MIRRFAVGTMLFVIGGLPGCDGTGAKRLPESGFQVAFESHKIASEMTSGKTVSADITVKNVSPVTWPSKPDKKDRYAVNLSYHWLNQKGAPVVFDGLRTPLPQDLKPGQSVNLKAAIQAPAKPGRYTLEVTLVQEHSAWFPEKNGAKLVLPVTVLKSSETTADAAGDAPIRMPVPAATQDQKIQASEKTGKPQTEATPASAVGGGSWSVQLGSYAEKKVATSLAKKLKDKGYNAYVSVVNIAPVRFSDGLTGVKGKDLHRVRVGRLEGRAQAEKLRDTLRTAEKLERAVVTSR